MSTRTLIATVVGILTVAAVILSLIFVAVNVGDKNRGKVVQLTKFCVEQGYSAWTDQDNGLSLCLGRGK